jgi:periplasmic protein CpxP/Spy
MKSAMIAAAVLGLAGVAAQAQMPAPMAAGSGAMGMHEGHGHPDAQRMQEHMQRRFESLKRILQLTPAQEGAWNAWTAAMKPSPQMVQQMQQRRAMHEEMARMSTPERIDRMRQTRAQHMAEMDRRADATKSFYAQLTAAQQKSFDEISLRFFAHRGHRGGHHGE